MPRPRTIAWAAFATLIGVLWVRTALVDRALARPREPIAGAWRPTSDVDYQDAELAAVLADVSTRFAVRIEVDWPVLRQLHPCVPVRLKLFNVSLAQVLGALERLLPQVEDEAYAWVFVIDQGHVHLTNHADDVGLVTRAYDLRGLRPIASPSPANGTGSGEFANVQLLIYETIDWRSWDTRSIPAMGRSAGPPPGHGSMWTFGDCLIVRQTPNDQYLIADLLRRVARVSASSSPRLMKGIWGSPR